MKVTHIRVIDRRADRRIMGAPGRSHTLCGAPVTDADVLYREARHIVDANVSVWPVCQSCRDIYLNSRADKQDRAAASDDVSRCGKADRPAMRRTVTSQHGAFRPRGGRS